MTQTTNETFKGLESLRAGDVVLFRTRFKIWSPMSWLSALIRFFTGSPFNHVGLIVINQGVPFVNEANERGLVTTRAGARLWGREKDIRILRRMDKTFKAPKTARDFSKIMNSYLGVSKYDFASLFIYQLIYQVFGTWHGRTSDAAKAFLYCSEYAALAHQDCFLHWWKVSPADVFKNSWFRHYEFEF